jgi:type I pantothenate kinase
MHERPVRSRLFRSANTFVELNHLLDGAPKAVDAKLIAGVLAVCATPGDTLIVGVTGSVAAGKTTFCAAVANHLHPSLRSETLPTDGFLLSNATLAAKGISLKKGFPESYDAGLLAGTLQRARWGAVNAPGYSHVTYDRAEELDRAIDRPDILLVEGLGFAAAPQQRDATAFLDLLIYIDAREADLEAWYVDRFMAFWREAESNSASFYARFRTMGAAEAEAFAHAVWSQINLPNLRAHILPVRQQADLLIEKSADHLMRLVPPGRVGGTN